MDTQKTSFLTELMALMDKYPEVEAFPDLNKKDEYVARDCISILNQIIKKREKKNKRERNQKREKQKLENKKKIQHKNLSEMQQKKLEEKTYLKTDEVQFDESNIGEYRSKCYCCNHSAEKYHSFYGSMCVPCGDLNFEMRNKKKDLTGYTAIVTGGRIKLGYATVLWLLRNGCYVIVTTRFPADALLRYKKESDYETFKDRLFLYGLDFRDLKKVYQFIDYVYNNFKEINILINNAAQTLYQTDAYNRQLQHDEEMALKAIQEDPANKVDNSLALIKPNQATADSQLNLLNTEFPVYDVNHIPVDFSTSNSWTKEIDEIEFREFAEAQVINSWVPFILCSKLKKIMEVPNKKSFIINVTSSEGKFYYLGKKSVHPHTNMAKASLNMMTRTCGAHYARSEIYMTSVDPGWFSEMHPEMILSGKRTVPLDEHDGAMRVLHPVFEELTHHSVLLKNYKVSTW